MSRSRLVPHRLNDGEDVLRIVVFDADNRLGADWAPEHAMGSGLGSGDSRGFVAESILIVSPSGKTMLIDAAWNSGYADPKWGGTTYGQNPIAGFLKERGIGAIDWMVMSHLHRDHSSGIRELVLSEDIEVRHVLWSHIPEERLIETGPETAAGYVELREGIEEGCNLKGARVVEAVEGQMIDLGDGVQCEVLSAARPELDADSYLNNNCVVIRLTYGAFTMLLMADAGFVQEERIMALGRDLATDVLKVGHHAGANSTGDAWVEALDAQVGVASMPRWLSEDERGIRVYDQLSASGMKLYRTWEHGHIEIQTDGPEFWVLTER